MTCAEVEERSLAEEYLLGRLSEADRDAYEAHYFECARCYQELEALRNITDALAARGPARQGGAQSWQWLALAATVVLAVGILIAWQVATRDRGASPPATTAVAPPARSAPVPPDRAVPEEVAKLARVEPPPFSDTRLRSGGERPAFDAGMRRYAAGDFKGAVPSLERALADNSRAEDARFYLGASYLLSGDAPRAVDTLAPLTRQTDSSYAEEAQFLTAKALLKTGDIPAARAVLEKIVALHGDRERDARSIVSALDRLHANR